MKIYIAGRQAGKTYWALEWLRRAERGELRVLLCISRSEAERLYKSTLDANGEPTYFREYQFVSVDELRADRYRGRQPHVVFGIDNLDLILPQLLGGQVAVATGTMIQVHHGIPTAEGEWND